MTNGEDDQNCRGYRGQSRQTTQEGKMRKKKTCRIECLWRSRKGDMAQTKAVRWWNKSQVWVIHFKTPYRLVS